MNTKIISTLTSLLMATSTFATGCNNTNQGEDVDIIPETTAITQTQLPPMDASFKESVVDSSLLSLGNGYRIRQKIAQMEAGEDTTIAYIGGSITYGLNAGNDDCYAKQSFNFISENFGNGDNVHYVNAGISGTPSVLGNIRLDRDVLSQNADIVFIEFAVNDGQDAIHKESYESMIKTILSQENQPAVILIFTVLEGGYSCQTHMSEIGAHYNLPMISVGDAINPEIKSGAMVWSDYGSDEAHPTKEGHKLIAEFISNYFREELAREDVSQSYEIPQMFKNGWSYENATLVDTTNFDSVTDFELLDVGSFSNDRGTSVFGFTKGWKYVKDSGNTSMKFKVTANSVFIVYKQTSADVGGTVDIYQDGVKMKSISAKDPSGWNNPVPVQVIKRQGVPEMEIEIKMAEGFEGKEFEILGIAFTQNEPFTLN